MSEAQGTKTPGRPWHLWLIGIIGGLWSSIGVISFMLTQMNVEAVMMTSVASRSLQQPAVLSSKVWVCDLSTFSGCVSRPSPKSLSD